MKAPDAAKLIYELYSFHDHVLPESKLIEFVSGINKILKIENIELIEFENFITEVKTGGFGIFYHNNYTCFYVFFRQYFEKKINRPMTSEEILKIYNRK